MTERETYTPEGWKALGRAARAVNTCHAGRDPKAIALAHDIFRMVLRRVNKECVVRLGNGEQASSKEG